SCLCSCFFIVTRPPAISTLSLHDALPMVFWPKSPRRVDPAIAAEIVATLPPDVLTVGVFVNATVDEIRDVVTTNGIRVVRLHGDEPTSYVDAIDRPIFRSVTLDNVVDVAHDWPARQL